MKTWNIPGAAWIAVLTFATTWLTQYFGDVVWVPTAIAVIGGIIKILELMSEPPPPPPGVMADPAQKQPSKVARWLVG
jgi:hypothetical protein